MGLIRVKYKIKQRSVPLDISMRGGYTMNNAILQDKIFRLYTKLPHCRICRRRHIKDVRSRFNYNELSDVSIFAANCTIFWG